MLRSERLLHYRQRTFVQRLRLGVVPMYRVKLGEAVEDLRGFEMVRPESTLGQLQRLPRARRRLVVMAIRQVGVLRKPPLGERLSLRDLIGGHMCRDIVPGRID